MPADAASPRRISLPLAAFLILALALGSVNLAGNLMNDDEGTYLYSAWRVSAGETPYRDFHVVQTPLSFWLVGGIFRIFGPAVGAARAVSYLLVLGAALFIYAAGRRRWRLSEPAAVCGAAMFFFTKHVFFLGRSFMPDDFLLFFGAAALYFFLRAEDENGRPGRDALLGGACAGLAALSKLNGALVFGGYLLFLAWARLLKKETPGAIPRKLASAAAGFFLTFGIPFGILLAFVPGAFFQTIAFHLGKGGAAGGFSPALPFIRLGQFAGNHDYGLVATALAGMGLAPGLKDKKRALALIAASSSFVFVFLPGRFFIRYAVFAFVPLALFFGAALDGLWKRKVLRYAALPAALILVGFCLGPTFEPAKLMAFDRGTRGLADFVRSHTGRDDFVFGDDPFINFLARRRCPPGLVDVSESWTAGGLITAGDIRRQCDAAGVRLIFVEKGHSAHHLVSLRDFDRFREYLAEAYRPAGIFKREFLDVEVYTRK